MDAKQWQGRTEFFQFANFGQFSLWYDWFELTKLFRPSLKRDRDIDLPLPMGLEPYVPSACVKFRLNTKTSLGREEDTPTPLGQLSLKEEAAGKIRVFAMVDVWTQSVLKPLHNWLFDLFKVLPNDSTHNQDVGFLRAKKKAIHYGHSWCYDLSAATDRLPIQLQSAILTSLFGHIPCSGHDTGISYGQAWADLLVKREYFLPGQTLSSKERIEPQSLKYAVGQPMGAYSSWAMLNLCHHLILQYINFSIYKVEKWYENYEVLGDDIVIYDRQVADHYIKLMEGGLDVQCNKSKSLLAPHRAVIEFAKRISIGESEVSAFSWRQICSFDSLLGRASVAVDLVSRRGLKYPLRAFKAVVRERWGPVPSYQYSLLTFAGIMVNRGLISFKTVADLLVDPENPLRYIGGRIIANVRVGVLENWLNYYVLGKPLVEPKLDIQALGRLMALNQAAARGYLEDRIVDQYKIVERVRKSYLTEIQNFFGSYERNGLLPQDLFTTLFYPGLKFIKSVQLVDLNTLSFEDLVDRIDHLDQIIRDYTFYRAPVERKEVLDDSFKLLRIIMKSRRRGSLSFLIDPTLSHPVYHRVPFDRQFLR
jgi:hypothetical protein